MNSPRFFSPIRRILFAGGVAAVITMSALGVTAYSYLKPTATASAAISTVPLTVISSSLTPADESAAAAPSVSTAGATIYDIQSSESKASFTIDEVLRGSPYTVVGTTDRVSGQIAFNASDPAAAQVGTVLIDARTLATDDSSRNRAIGNQILDTNQYEYISFTPTQLTGLPESVSPGQSFTFQTTGELTIKDVSKPATFNVTLTPAADGSLSGSATTTIQYADWGVSIPNVPFVASINDEVALQLDFTASTAAA